MTTDSQCSAPGASRPPFGVAGIRRYSDIRHWFRATMRNALHNAIGAILALFGTNGIESSVPESLQAYVAGIGLNWEQALAVFVVTLATSVLRSVHAATADTTPPFPPRAESPLP